MSTSESHGIPAEDIAKYGHLTVEQYLTAKMETQVLARMCFFCVCFWS
jgi:hypothetical protein